MKSNRPTEPDEGLNQVLRTWEVRAPLPPRFNERVWERIGAQERTAGSPLRGLLLGLVEVVLPRPRVAVAYLAVLLVLGVVAGTWAAQRENSRLDQSLGSRYVQSLDPYRSPAGQ